MATYCCEEVMPLELALHRELAFQKKRRGTSDGDGLPFSDPPPLSFPLPQPALPDSLLLLDRDVPRKRLQEAAAAARRGRAAQLSLETIPAEVAMRREISLRRRAERGPSPPSHPRLPRAIKEGRNPRCFPERTAASNSGTASRVQSSASFGESTSASSQRLIKSQFKGVDADARLLCPTSDNGLHRTRENLDLKSFGCNCMDYSTLEYNGFPPTVGLGFTRNIVDRSTARSSQQRSYNQQLLSAQRFCDICRVSCQCAIGFYQHCAGKQHKAKLEKLKGSKINHGSFFCDICKISCPDMSSLIQHRHGKKHAAQIQAIKAQKKRALGNLNISL